MKKKIIALFVAFVFVIALCSCGNMSVGLGSYNFYHVHITDYIEGHCFDVKKWYDNSTGIEFCTPDNVHIFCSEGSYMLFEDEDDCPYCHKGEK